MKFSDVWKSVRKVGEEKVAAFYSTGRSHPPSSDVIEPRVDKDDPTLPRRGWFLFTCHLLFARSL